MMKKNRMAQFRLWKGCQCEEPGYLWLKKGQRAGLWREGLPVDLYARPLIQSMSPITQYLYERSLDNYDNGFSAFIELDDMEELVEVYGSREQLEADLSNDLRRCDFSNAISGGFEELAPGNDYQIGIFTDFCTHFADNRLCLFPEDEYMGGNC